MASEMPDTPAHPNQLREIVPENRHRNVGAALSHMFGQALAIFFPPLINAATVFMTGYNPDQVIAQGRRHRITLVVTVPRVLEMLRDRVRHLAPACATPDPSGRALPVRLWRYRDAHALFGWRFCGFVLGGAQLD